MNIYSSRLVHLITYLARKVRGALALYRFRSLFKDVHRSSRCALSTEIKYPDKISIGHSVGIGPECTLGGFAGIVIGNNVRISKGVVIESAGLDLCRPLPYRHIGKPIYIKDGAWLGAGCKVLAGVTVGEYAVVGAGAVVTKDIPAYQIVAGQGLRVIGSNDK